MWFDINECVKDIYLVLSCCNKIVVKVILKRKKYFEYNKGNNDMIMIWIIYFKYDNFEY